MTAFATRVRRASRAALALGVAVLGACSEPTIPDYNNPSEGDYSTLRTRAQLQAQASGLADGDRLSHDFQILVAETMARNVYRLDGAESRYITQPLGASLSPDVFVGASTYVQPYRTIRSAQNLIDITRTAPDELPESAGGAVSDFTAGDKAATIGYAQTIKALQYLRLFETRDTVGIAIYTNPDAINPLRCGTDILNLVSALLDSAATDLGAASEDFPFVLPSGFAGFDTPATFLRFNRALKARNEVYRAFDLYARTATGAARTTEADRRANINTTALAAAQAALDASFLNPAALDSGVFHTYFTAGGDYLNPNFNTAIYRINPRVVYESEGATVTVDANGDTTAVNVPDQRIQAKVELDPTNNCRTIRDATSCFLDRVNASATDPLPIIRSDELYLLQAEVYWGLGQYAQALAIVNDLRARAGLVTPLTQAQLGLFTTDDGQKNLLRAILREKRNQLLFETTTRLADFRKYGLVGELGNERLNAGDDEEWGTDDDFEGYPALSNLVLPRAEILARNNVVTKSCGS